MHLGNFSSYLLLYEIFLNSLHDFIDLLGKAYLDVHYARDIETLCFFLIPNFSYMCNSFCERELYSILNSYKTKWNILEDIFRAQLYTFLMY